LTDAQNHHVKQRPVWEKVDEENRPDPKQCQRGEHTWVAFFFESGRLAYWRCEGCGEQDREIEEHAERLDTINDWIKDPPRLVMRGGRPMRGTRKWVTPEGTVLVEGDPSSNHFVGRPIPGLPEAHTYVRMDGSGKIEEVYEPIREQPWRYTDHYWLIRYLVIGGKLVRFESHCYEESTYEVPSAGKPKRKVVLTDLKLLPE
jgi:hypothetical protein